MELTDKFTISPEAIARQVGDETVILDLAGEAYFGLNRVGTRIWQLMDEGKTVSEICDALIEQYDVSRDQLEQDTLRLARNLAEKSLILPA